MEILLAFVYFLISFRSRACPECRTLCTDKDIFRIFFTFDSETTGIALNAKIENIELEFCTKIKEAELFVSDDINAIKEQQSRYIEETEEKLMLLNKQFKDQLKAEQDFKIKMQKKIKRMEKKSSEVVGEVVQKLVLLAVLAIIYFHWFKEVWVLVSKVSVKRL